MDTTPSLSDVSQGHLRLLSIFHYVVAAFAALGPVFLALHYLFLSRMLEVAAQSPGQSPPPDGLLDVFVWFYVVMGAACVLGMVLNFLAARSLAARRRWTLCAVVAGLNCLQMPLGTILGVFTLIVLVRPEVRAGFGE